MISGGLVTVFVYDMDKAARFYTETLGLKLGSRFGNEWASVDAGKDLTIGLHPASRDSAAGEKGSIMIGLQLTESIQEAVSALREKGVHFLGPVIDDEYLWVAHCEDPDGNALYVYELKREHDREAAQATR